MKASVPTKQELYDIRLHVYYDAEAGCLCWGHKGRPHGNGGYEKKYAGAVAGSTLGAYSELGIKGKHYKAHRVVWFLCHGKWPTFFIDHIDCDKHHNNISNLRPVNHSQNAINTGLYSTNTSGYKGVCRYKTKWQAYIRFEDQKFHLGTFDNIEDAAAARKKREVELFGEFSPGA